MCALTKNAFVFQILVEIIVKHPLLRISENSVFIELIFNENCSCYEGEKDCVHGSCRRENDRPYCNCDSGFIRDSDGNCTVCEESEGLSQ